MLQGKAGGGRGGDKNRFQKAGKPIEVEILLPPPDSSAGGALCRSMSPNSNALNINVLNINELHINHEWLKFRAHLLYQKLCRSTALYINKKTLEGRLHS